MRRILHLFPASLFVIFFLFVSVLIKPGSVRADTFAGGNGSQTNPYRVATCEQLQAMQDTSGTNFYILAGDVNCSATNTWNGGKGFTPLNFSGTFDGRNHTIQNLYINDPTSDNLGMFGVVTVSTFLNIKMTGANITGRDFVGGMFYALSNSEVRGVSFSGNVTGRNGVGGLAVMANASDFSRCSASGTITSTSSAVVGLIVWVNNAVTISDCYVNTDLVGANVAGLVGTSFSGPTVIERSYVAGSMLDSGSQTGFLGGTDTNAVWINNNLVVANMSAGSPAYFDSFNLDAPSQTGNYFDMKQTGAVDCGSSGYNNAECIGVSGEDGGGNPTYPFKNTTSVAPFTAWDFTDMWQVTADYPTLRDAPLDPIGPLAPTLSDTLTRIKVNTPSDHQIDFSSVNGLQSDGDSFTVNFGTAWDLSTLGVSDLDLLVNGVNVNLDLLPVSADTWGVFIDSSAGRIIFSAPASGSGYINPLDPVQLLIGTNAVYGGTSGIHQITNPVTVGSYPVQITVHNTVSGNEAYGYNIPIIDSDQVNITSYVNTSLSFALHTGTFTSAVGGPANDGTGIGANTEMSDPCTAATCFSYYHTDLGINTAPGNYTVDLGNLTAGTPNLSNTTALHQDGGTGIINDITFDLSSNAANGSTVTLASQNGALTRNGGAPDNWDIPSGSHGAGVGDVSAPIDFLTLASHAGNAYGFKFGMVPAYINLGTNATDPATTMQNVSGCTSSDIGYCTLSITPQTILSTGDVVEGLKATLALGALANGTNPAGTYTDTLTFIATASF